MGQQPKSSSQSVTPPQDSSLTPFVPISGHGSSSFLSVAVQLLPPTLVDRSVSMLWIQALNQPIRFTLDGSTPTAQHGFRLAPGAPPLRLAIPPSTPVKIIEEVAGAVVQFQWGKT